MGYSIEIWRKLKKRNEQGNFEHLLIDKYIITPKEICSLIDKFKIKNEDDIYEYYSEIKEEIITSNEQLREGLNNLIPTVKAKSKFCDIINKFKAGRRETLKVDTLFKIAKEFNLNVEIKISKHEPVNNKQA